VRSSFCLLEADAIEPLVGAIVEKEPLTAEAALTALSTLMTDSCKWEASVKIIHQTGGAPSTPCSLRPTLFSEFSVLSGSAGPGQCLRSQEDWALC